METRKIFEIKIWDKNIHKEQINTNSENQIKSNSSSSSPKNVSEGYSKDCLATRRLEEPPVLCQSQMAHDREECLLDDTSPDKNDSRTGLKK